MSKEATKVPGYTSGGPYEPSVKVNGDTFSGPVYSTYTGQPIPWPTFGTPKDDGSNGTFHGVVVLPNGIGMAHYVYRK